MVPSPEVLCILLFEYYLLSLSEQNKKLITNHVDIDIENVYMLDL